METTGRTDAGGAAIGCALVGRDFAERKEAIARDLFAHADGVEELADGYGWRFPAAEPWATRALEFVLSERRCCPFFAFELALEPHDGPLWLRMRGGPEAKAFVLEELGALLPPALRPTGA
jgi:hypothetical protein